MNMMLAVLAAALLAICVMSITGQMRAEERKTNSEYVSDRK